MKHVFVREWRAGRKAMLIWAASVSTFILTVMAMYPLFEKEMGQMIGMFSNLGVFTTMFGLDKINMASPMGFFGLEGGVMLSIAGSMYGAMTGIVLVAKEEGRRTAEFLFAQPVGRVSALLGKLLFLAVSVLLFNLIVTLLALLAFSLAGGGLVAGDFTRLMASQTLMHLQVGLMCFGLSCFLRSDSVAPGIGVMLLLYVLSLFINIVKALRLLRFLTPFYYADYANVAGGGMLWAEIAAGYALATLAAAAGIFYYRKKDLGN